MYGHKVLRATHFNRKNNATLLNICLRYTGEEGYWIYDYDVRTDSSINRERENYTNVFHNLSTFYVLLLPPWLTFRTP
jgi:hypothetical protein